MSPHAVKRAARLGRAPGFLLGMFNVRFGVPHFQEGKAGETVVAEAAQVWGAWWDTSVLLPASLE